MTHFARDNNPARSHRRGAAALVALALLMLLSTLSMAMVQSTLRYREQLQWNQLAVQVEALADAGWERARRLPLPAAGETVVWEPAPEVFGPEITARVAAQQLDERLHVVAELQSGPRRVVRAHREGPY